HAIAALRFSAGLTGWRAALLPAWSHRAIAALTGIDRHQDYVDAEREEPACVLLVSAGDDERRPDVAALADAGGGGRRPDAAPLADAAARGRWHGRASQLSEDHVEWTFIDEVARAT